MGAGPLWLLEGIAGSGSIRQAAQAMGMSYAKAHRIVGRLEARLDTRLLVRRTGGMDRGGAELTPAGRALLELWRSLQQRLQEEAEREFATFRRSWEQACAGPVEAGR